MEPSKVGVAREYVAILADIPHGSLDSKSTSHCMTLLDKITKELKLPTQIASPQRIYDAKTAAVS